MMKLNEQTKRCDRSLLVTCPVVGSCSIFDAETEREDAEAYKQLLDQRHKDCKPENHCIDEMSFQDAVVVHQLYTVQPREWERAADFVRRVYEGAYTQLVGFGDDYDLPEAEEVGVWLVVRFTSGAVGRYWFHWSGDPDSAPEIALKQAQKPEGLLVYRANRSPVHIRYEAIAAIEADSTDATGLSPY